MATSSPSEFLTFYRRIATRQTVRIASARPLVARPFHNSSAFKATGDTKDKQHATRKDDNLDVQSRSADSATKSKSTDTGGVATREKDENNAAAKAKKDFPEAPDTAIGMQDERGSKGH